MGCRSFRNFLAVADSPAVGARRAEAECDQTHHRVHGCSRGQVVKGVQFQQLRHAGDPAELAQRYNVEGIDEVVVLDITATLESRQGARSHDQRGCTPHFSTADGRRRDSV